VVRGTKREETDLPLAIRCSSAILESKIMLQTGENLREEHSLDARTAAAF
jgi:hypothetical protein